ncbi:MAG TPA: phosphatase PAP2-related protein [Saprospiraceae bacterium]|nr:phosphatase PAP2-related protein [Saprospiraceae bacterium]
MVNKFYLPSIETRDGFRPFDPILTMFEPQNFSTAIFVIEYCSILFGFFYVLSRPHKLLTILYSFGTMYLIRLICILAVPFIEPSGLIELYDPVVNSLLLHNGFLKRDLFFSGHMASMFLIFLYMEGRLLKWIFGLLSLFLAYFLLCQHVHYSYDLVAAMVFAFVSKLLSEKFIGSLSDYEHLETVSDTLKV